MSKGMWTKQLTVDGRVFYYNSTHNKSQWHQPSPVEVLHEAPHLSIPHSPSDSHLQHQNDEILSSSSASQCNEQTSSSYADSHRAHQVQAFGITSSHMPRDETLSSGTAADEIRNPALLRSADLSNYSEPALSIQQIIDSALQKNYNAQVMKRPAANKEKATDAQIRGTPATVAGGGYLQQKNLLEQMAGCKDSDTSKWLNSHRKRNAVVLKLGQTASTTFLSSIKSSCHHCVKSFAFWAVVGLLIVSEPILCFYFSYGLNYRLQVGVLALSSMLFFVQLVGVATVVSDAIRDIEQLLLQDGPRANSGLTMFNGPSSRAEYQFFLDTLLKFFTSEGEYIFEFVCLLGGWITIFTYPGIAILRCFRVFRLLWFYEVKVVKDSIESTCSPLLGAETVSMIFRVSKFAIRAFQAIGSEMFRLTEATRGALLLIMVMFYFAFVLGMSFAIETRGDYSGCSNASQCTFTLLRLAFFDGSGFDFAFYLAQYYRFLFGVSLLFVCITSFGIMNGLVGIFGRLFNQASMEAFQQSSSTDDIIIGNEDDEDSQHEGHAYKPADGNNGNDNNNDFVKLAKSRLTGMGFTGNALRYAVNELQSQEDRCSGSEEDGLEKEKEGEDAPSTRRKTRRGVARKVFVEDSEQGYPVSSGPGLGRRQSLIQQLVGVRRPSIHPTITSMHADDSSMIHSKLDAILASVQSLRVDEDHSKRVMQDLLGIAEALKLQQHRLKKIVMSRRRRPNRTSRRNSGTIATLEPIVLRGLEPTALHGLVDSSAGKEGSSSGRKRKGDSSSNTQPNP